MTEAVYQKGGRIVFPHPKCTLLFSLSLPGVSDGTVSYGGRRTKVTRAKAVLDFSGMEDGDYPIDFSEGVQTFTVASVRKTKDALFDISCSPEVTAELCERLAKAEKDLQTLTEQVAALQKKIGTEEIFTL